MIVHLENGGCVAGWRIQYLNAIAEDCPAFAKNILKERTPWLRAGAPRKYAWAGDETQEGKWTCYLCRTSFGTQPSLTDHLKNSHSKEYPEVLRCPCCKGKFTKISGLLQHIETLRCPANYEEPSIVALLAAVKFECLEWRSKYKEPEVEYKLEFNAGDRSELLVKVGKARSLCDNSAQTGTKRKRSCDEEDSKWPRHCDWEWIRGFPLMFD